MDDRILAKVKTVIPAQCHLWSKAKLSGIDLSFKVVEEYSQESHSSRMLVECTNCGQRYYRDFDEQVDWEGGNDAQYWTFIPIIPDQETVVALNKLSTLDLRRIKPNLVKGWGPKDKEVAVRWVR